MSIANVNSIANVDQSAYLGLDIDEWFGQGPGYGDAPDVLPAGWSFGHVSGVATHPDGEVYVFQRGRNADPILAYSRDGTFRRSWGRGLIGEAHGLRLDHHGDLWATDCGTHQVYQFSRAGDLLLTLGQRGVAGATAETFNMPTDIGFGPDDTVYISDGYGNSRVVHYTRDGQYLGSWGRPGTGPGEFDTPHSIAVAADGTVYVSDRANQRVQAFDAQGRHQFDWNHVGSVNGITITPDGDCWIVTGIMLPESNPALVQGYRVANLELPTGRILGLFECNGHMVDRSAWGEIFVAALSGNAVRWTPR